MEVFFFYNERAFGARLSPTPYQRGISPRRDGSQIKILGAYPGWALEVCPAFWDNYSQSWQERSRWYVSCPTLVVWMPGLVIREHGVVGAFIRNAGMGSGNRGIQHLIRWRGNSFRIIRAYCIVLLATVIPIGGIPSVDLVKERA